MDEGKNQKRRSLNSIRYHFFLDPAGSNRGWFELVMARVSKSLLDWYFPGCQETERPGNKRKLIFRILSQNEKSEEEVEEHFRQREELMREKCEKPVPGRLSRSEAIEMYNLGGDGKFPEHGMCLEDVLHNLDIKTDPSIRFNQNFLGEMHPHDNIPAFAASYISKFLNANAIVNPVSPSISYLENVTMRWVASLIGYNLRDYSFAEKHGLTKEEFDIIPPGSIVSGGTVANITALLAARNRLGEVKKKGLAEYVGKEESKEYEGCVIFCSKAAHYSIKKAGNILGAGNDKVVEIETDSEGRMDIGCLEDEISKAKGGRKKILAVVATAGTTEQGAIDPLEKVADIAEREGIYFHVDAAHGGAFMASEKMRHKFKGIERADSVTVDGHKMFYTNYSCGCILFKDKVEPSAGLQEKAEYILSKSSEHYDSGNSTVEGSRSTDGILQLYASIKALGGEGYETVLGHAVDMAGYLANLVDASPVLERIHDPEMNILCFRYVPEGWDRVLDAERIDRLNEDLNKEIYNDGEYYIGSTKVGFQGRKSYVQRAIIVHPYVEKGTIEGLVAKIRDIGERLAQGSKPGETRRYKQKCQAN